MPSPITRHFRTSGLSLLFRCNVTGFAEVASEILEHHGLRASEGDRLVDFTIELNSAAGSIDIPDAAREMAVHDSGLEMLYLDRTRFLRRGEARAKIDLSTKHVVLAVPVHGARDGDRVGTDLYLMIIFSLIIVLQECGRFALHAAAVCASREQGILLVGASDCGKSTMTMHLARQGWSYVTDDSVLLFSGDGTVEATPLRKDFALDPDAADQFPEIAEHSKPLLTDPRKRQVVSEDIFPGKRHECCIPRVLIFPELVERHESRLAQLGPTDAFLNLLRQSSFLTHETADGTSQAAVLSKLVQQTTAYRLEAGEDIKRDGQLLSKILAKTLKT